MMHNHGNRNVVNLLEQLTELFKAQVMPGIRRLIKMSWKEDLEDAEQNGEKGLYHFFLWSSLEAWDHTLIKWTSLDPWWGHSRNTRKAILFFPLRQGCRNNSYTSPHTFRTTGRDCRQRGKREGGRLKCLLTTDGLILGMSPRRSMSAPQMLNCWLWVPVHVVYGQLTCATCHCCMCIPLLPGYRNSIPTHRWTLKISTTPSSLLHFNFLHLSADLYFILFIYL